jgi:hypothetical protein
MTSSGAGGVRPLSAVVAMRAGVAVHVGADDAAVGDAGASNGGCNANGPQRAQIAQLARRRT